MPRPHTLPTLYNECKTISITSLKGWGYLKRNQFISGNITWSRNDYETGSIGISVYTYGDQPYLQLNYKSNDKPISYKVSLLCIPSNIGKGVVWYFRCPNTGKKCRKLYLVGGYFLHRTAFRGCMYEKQTYSHNNRILCRKFEKLFGADKICEEMYGKYFKKHYKGKPTKRYVNLMQRLIEADSIDERNLLSHLK